MSENDEERLLHEICRNSSMGREAIHEVLKDVYDEEFAYELHVQEGKMQEFEQRARQRLRQSGKDAAEPGPLTSGMLKAAVRMKTAVSGRTSQVAEMIRKGNQRGTEELKKAIHKYRNAGIYATELAREMIDFEEDNQENMKRYGNRA